MNEGCVAFAYTKNHRMCTHCEESNLCGQGLDIPHNEVMIVVEKLEAYINGELFKIKCVFLQIPSVINVHFPV